MGNDPIEKEDIRKHLWLVYLLLIIMCILFYSQTASSASANSGGATLSLNLQDVTQWLFGALLLCIGWILRKVDKNQTSLTERVNKHDKEIYQLKGALMGAGDS